MTSGLYFLASLPCCSYLLVSGLIIQPSTSGRAPCTGRAARGWRRAAAPLPSCRHRLLHLQTRGLQQKHFISDAAYLKPGLTGRLPGTGPSHLEGHGCQDHHRNPDPLLPPSLVKSGWVGRVHTCLQLGGLLLYFRRSAALLGSTITSTTVPFACHAQETQPKCFPGAAAADVGNACRICVTQFSTNNCLWPDRTPVVWRFTYTTTCSRSCLRIPKFRPSKAERSQGPSLAANVFVLSVSAEAWLPLAAFFSFFFLGKALQKTGAESEANSPTSFHATSCIFCRTARKGGQTLRSCAHRHTRTHARKAQ